MTRLFALVLCAFALVGVTACGGGSSDKSAADVLKDTFGADHPIKSGRLDVGLKLNLSGLSGVNGPVDIRLRGPFKSNGGRRIPAFDFDLSLAASGTTFTAGAVSTGDAGFVKFQGSTYDLGKDLFERFRKGYEDAAKQSGTSKDSGPSLKSLGIDPQRWLRNPVKVGEEDVGGTKTVHVKAQVDVAALLQDVDTVLRKAGNLGVKNASVPQGLSAAERRQVQDAIKTTAFDVWSGKDDGTLRRLRVAVSFDAPKGTSSKTGALSKGDVALDVTIADLNKDQTINPPSGTKPLSDLTSQLSGVLGTASGSGSSGSGSSSSGASTSSSKYLDCLQSAGSDLAKVQRCQDLLGQ
jgi:hypothetical protein